VSETLQSRVKAGLAQDVAEPVRLFAERLARDAGASAALFYGSNLRTGSLEGVLDFYLLLPGDDEGRLWPRVSYHEWLCDGATLRAKVATMTLATFQAAAAGKLRDTTIWARFVQPSALVWAADGRIADELAQALVSAAITAARLAAALGPERGQTEEFWRDLFQATYRAEFRIERSGREDSILAANQAHFEGLLPLAFEAADIPFCKEGDILAPRLETEERRRILQWWRHRRRLSKTYNLLRLLRASTTFEGAARYAAWKVERHTGVPIKLTSWRERHPVLAAPSVLWQVWRARRNAS
jgi:hypothetical protein